MSIRSLSEEASARKPKAKRSVIFDVDQILIDSQAVDLLRQQRKWGEVYGAIPRLPPFPGIEGLMKFLTSRGIAIGLATARPKRYCELVAKRWKFNVGAMVTFEDKLPKKPNPDPIKACLVKLGAPAEHAIAVCLDVQDVEAANAAGVYSVAAMWSPPPAQSAASSNPRARCGTPAELEQLVKKLFELEPRVSKP